jgi:hypothetical protein
MDHENDPKPLQNPGKVNHWPTCVIWIQFQGFIDRGEGRKKYNKLCSQKRRGKIAHEWAYESKEI